jgi:AhpD family alkylhydroperoxidase
MSLVKQFNEYRTKMNARIMDSDSLIIKRIFNLDTNAYQEGNLDVKTKELIGLTCSLVLRCDDCVKYHLEKCKDVGFSTSEVQGTRSNGCSNPRRRNDCNSTPATGI